MTDFVNRNKLRGKMAENSYTQTTLSKELDICRQSLSDKLAGKSQFSESEIAILAKKFGEDVFYLE